jgi:hypothetical protein
MPSRKARVTGEIRFSTRMLSMGVLRFRRPFCTTQLEWKNGKFRSD